MKATARTAAGNTRPRAPRPKEDRHFVAALARGLEVLACFRSGDKALGNGEIAQRCGLPKSTVSRLTTTLARLGYLAPVEDTGKYRLGSAVLSLGSAMLARMDVRQVARPLMLELAEHSRAMVSLATRDRLSMIYVENCRSSAALTLSLDVGSRVPVATSAIGRAYLAACAERERRDVMEQVEQLDPVAWPGIRRGIEQAVADHQQLGVACSFGDWQKDVNAIARAVNPGGGMPLMAINCGGPSFNLSKEFLLNEARPRLIELVQRIEDQLLR
ncbi:IclR family transcriptional regulator [Ideonella sp. BN130291]|uniref:IclR family transcriptional regulator n=1 Tax=Ideonella sp. BN130291 TaxID=3112940 RepID=UPI002E25F576|nr:IclR family transcriptional regulator [Ideonella sp. BN130291]